MPRLALRVISIFLVFSSRVSFAQKNACDQDCIRGKFIDALGFESSMEAALGIFVYSPENQNEAPRVLLDRDHLDQLLPPYFLHRIRRSSPKWRQMTDIEIFQALVEASNALGEPVDRGLIESKLRFHKFKQKVKKGSIDPNDFSQNKEVRNLQLALLVGKVREQLGADKPPNPKTLLELVEAVPTQKTDSKGFFKDLFAWNTRKLGELALTDPSFQPVFDRWIQKSIEFWNQGENLQSLCTLEDLYLHRMELSESTGSLSGECSQLSQPTNSFRYPTLREIGLAKLIAEATQPSMIGQNIVCMSNGASQPYPRISLDRINSLNRWTQHCTIQPTQKKAIARAKNSRILPQQLGTKQLNLPNYYQSLFYYRGSAYDYYVEYVYNSSEACYVTNYQHLKDKLTFLGHPGNKKPINSQEQYFLDLEDQCINLTLACPIDRGSFESHYHRNSRVEKTNSSVQTTSRQDSHPKIFKFEELIYKDHPFDWFEVLYTHRSGTNLFFRECP